MTKHNIKLTAEQKKLLTDLYEDILVLQSEIKRAKKAGINMTEQENELRKMETDRQKLLRVYGTD